MEKNILQKHIHAGQLILIIVCLLIQVSHSYAQWQPDVRLTNNAASSSTAYNNARCIASSGNLVHAVWYDNRDGNPEIYYKRSADGGLNWGTDMRLTNNFADSYEPSISVSGSTVHVVWNDNRDGNDEIYYKRSTDGGVNWGTDTRLTNNTGISYSTSMSVSGTVVHVVWYDYRDGNSEIYYKRSTDGGVNWGLDIRLTNNSSSSEYPSVSVSGSAVHAVWVDKRDGNNEIYYKSSTDGGFNWGMDTRLTNNSLNSDSPSISASVSAVYVVWNDNRDGGNEEIYYKCSTDGGMNWENDMRLTNNAGVSIYPSISASGSTIHIVWSDYSYGNYEIFYKRSTDRGVNWETETRLTNDLADSDLPSISVSASTVHVVWADIRDGNAEIYYKSNPTINPFGAPILLNPVQGATGVNIPPTIDWTDVPGAEKYRFQVSMTTSFTSNIYDFIVYSSTYLLSSFPLQNGTTYYWRVSSISRQDTSAWAGFFMFTTILSAPNLIYPQNGSTNISITPDMDWDTVTSATGYWIQLSTDNGFANIIYQNTVFHPASNLSIPGGVLNYATTYYWRVAGINTTLQGTWSGVWNFTTGSVGVTNLSMEIPKEHKLYNNYPNPFNPVTNIRFDLPKSSNVKLAVYDIQGRQIEILVNEKLSAGVYKADFNAGRLSSGVYIYRLITEDYTATKRMILIK